MEKVRTYPKEFIINNFRRLKTRVLKKFPEAKIVVERPGKYYLSDKFGNRILQDMNMYPSCDSVFEAWYNVDYIIKVNHIIESNSARFTDEKIEKTFGKE